MRQHPLLAFATAVSIIAIALLGAVGSAGAATAGHRSAQSTSTSRSTLAAGSALTLPITLAPPVTLASSTATRHSKPSLKASKRSKHETRGRLDVKVSKDVSIERHVFVPLGGVWSQLRSCESGGNYSADTGNGYYGAYQFALSTWRGLQLGGLPSSAPPQIQDDAAVRLQKLDGWDPWPRCSGALGLRV
jgi:hypothetical protein